MLLPRTPNSYFTLSAQSGQVFTIFHLQIRCFDRSVSVTKETYTLRLTSRNTTTPELRDVTRKSSEINGKKRKIPGGVFGTEYLSARWEFLLEIWYTTSSYEALRCVEEESRSNTPVVMS